MLYVGNKKYILVSSKMNNLTTKEESQRMRLEQCPFVLVLRKYWSIQTSQSPLSQIYINL